MTDLEKVKETLEDALDYLKLIDKGTYGNMLVKELVEAKRIVKNLTVTHSSAQSNVLFNVGDKVYFDNKEAVVLWTSVKYVDIEICGTNKILQGVHTSLVMPR